jgi:acetylornithine deacetylase/succinyl-diaminopimelate desuccinylase-like protein
MYDLLRNRVHGLSEPALDLTRNLIRTPSVSFDEAQAASLVERTMRSFGFDRVVRDDYGNVLGILFGREAAPTVLLVSHIDTVPVASPEAWQYAPWSATTNGTRLLGVGAADCKAGLAAQMFAAVALKRSLLPLRGNLVVAATVAEENGASVGLRLLIEQTLPALNLAPDYAILGEPTDLGLYYGHEGFARLNIEVEGRDLFMVSDAGKAIFEDFTLNGAGGRHNNGKENIAISAPRVVTSGKTPRAVVSMTRRLLQGEAVTDVIAQTKYCASASARGAGSVGVEVELASEKQRLATGQSKTVSRLSQPWSTDPFGPLAVRAHDALAAAGCAVRPGQWKLDRLGMGTAGGALVNDYKIPTIGYGPGTEQAAHAQDEYIEIPHLTEAIYGTAAIVHALIGVPVYGWTADEI